MKLCHRHLEQEMLDQFMDGEWPTMVIEGVNTRMSVVALDSRSTLYILDRDECQRCKEEGFA